MALTNTAIRNAKPREKPYKLADSLGLYILVNPTGSKLWRVKYRSHGVERKLALGSYPEVSLAEAREARDAARKQLTQHVDPNVAKRRAKIEASKSPLQALDAARDYFEEWLPNAAGFLKVYKFCMSEGDWKRAAFLLHQATESLYQGLLLTLTLYTPLCRTRHNGVYAERHTMPSGRGMSLFSSNFAVTGSA